MVAAAENLGFVVCVGALAVSVILEWGHKTATPFCGIDVEDGVLRFHALVPEGLEPQTKSEAPGVYLTGYSVKSLSIVERRLVAGPPDRGAG